MKLILWVNQVRVMYLFWARKSVSSITFLERFQKEQYQKHSIFIHSGYLTYLLLYLSFKKKTSKLSFPRNNLLMENSINQIANKLSCKTWRFVLKNDQNRSLFYCTRTIMMSMNLSITCLSVTAFCLRTAAPVPKIARRQATNVHW